MISCMKSANIPMKQKPEVVDHVDKTDRILRTVWPVISMAKGQESKKEKSLLDKTLEMHRRYREQN